MNKIKVAVGFMALALAGLITVQFYWIDKAISVNREIFKRQVNDVLQDVALKLERKDAFIFISKLNQRDTVILPDVGIRSLTPGALKPFLQYDLQKLRLLNSCFNYPYDYEFPDYNFTNPTDAQAFTNELFAMDTDTSAQALNDVNKILKKKYLLQKLAVDLVQRSNSIEQRIDFKALDTLIYKELRNKNIRIHFEYGIFQEHRRDLTKFTSNSDTSELISSEFQARLFPNDFFLSPNYLKIYFPGQGLFLMKRIASIMASSFIFILMIIFIFLWMIKSFIRQKKLSEMKTDFINNMTHELKTPITTIALAGEALQDNSIGKDQKRLHYLAGLIVEENKRLEMQVERVLQMAKLDRSAIEIQGETVDLHEIIDAAVRHIELPLKECEGVLHLHLDAKNYKVKGDAVYLTNIIFNLLDNAVKYSENKPQITIKSYNEDKNIVIEVIDTGIGMSSEHQKRIFEKFYRVPTGNIHNVKGFGLGLSYVKSMTDAHKGTISVKSSLGKGSTFKLCLPVDL